MKNPEKIKIHYSEKEKKIFSRNICAGFGLAAFAQALKEFFYPSPISSSGFFSKPFVLLQNIFNPFLGEKSGFATYLCVGLFFVVLSLLSHFSAKKNVE